MTGAEEPAPSRPAPPPMLAIVGLGCIGGSIALRARSLGVRVAGFDLPEPLGLALALGSIDVALSSFEEATRSSLLVLATPPAVTCEYLARLATMPPVAGVVIDVASVKAVVAEAGAAVPAFVPTHPIAGSERSGPTAATADLFVDRAWAIVPQGSEEARMRARAFVTAMGARPFDVTAVEHDRAVSITSHMPQLVSVALAAGVAPLLDDPAVAALAGPGLASMVRLGGSSWELWRDVVTANRANVVNDVRAVAALLGEIARTIEDDDLAALEVSFASAAATARRMAGANPRVSTSVS